MILKINHDHISTHKISQVVKCLREGGVIIYPTDTVYAIGCDAFNHKAVERVIDLKNAKKKGLNFSFACSDLSHLSEFATHVSTPIYKLMKQTLPGPYTYILTASSKVPTIFKAKKKTIGIRVPDNEIAKAIINELGNPLLTTSLLNEKDSIVEYETDAELIEEKFRKLVDMVVDGGPGGILASTIINCSGDHIIVEREGAGNLSMIDLICK